MVALKLARVGGTGALLANPALKLARVGGTGAVVVILNPLPTQVVEPGTLVTVTATPAGLAGYTWRVITSGVTLSGTGATRTFTGPSSMPTTPTDPGLSVVVGVTGTDGTTTSPEQQGTITVRKQLRWFWVVGGSWVGSTGISAAEQFISGGTADALPSDIISGGSPDDPDFDTRLVITGGI